MIYLTDKQDIYKNLKNFYRSLTVVKEAKKRNECLFQKLFNKELNNYLISRYVKSIHLSAEQIENETKKFDMHIKDTKISDIERKLYLCAKESFLKAELYRTNLSLSHPYNELNAVSDFKNIYDNNILYLEKLPQKIIAQIAR